MGKPDQFLCSYSNFQYWKVSQYGISKSFNPTADLHGGCMSKSSVCLLVCLSLERKNVAGVLAGCIAYIGYIKDPSHSAGCAGRYISKPKKKLTGVLGNLCHKKNIDLLVSTNYLFKLHPPYGTTNG